MLRKSLYGGRRYSLVRVGAGFRALHTRGVTGSIPVPPTMKNQMIARRWSKIPIAVIGRPPTEATDVTDYDVCSSGWTGKV